MDRPTASELTARMVGIGMLFVAKPAERPQIEKTLLLASEAAMVDDDFRVLDVLVNWLGVHCRYVNADRLFRIVKPHESVRVQAFWAAMAQRHATDHRLSRFAKLHTGDRIDVLSTRATEFQVGRHGEHERFSPTWLHVGAGGMARRRGRWDRAGWKMTGVSTPGRVQICALMVPASKWMPPA